MKTGTQYRPKEVSAEVQALFDQMSTFVDTYLTEAERIDPSDETPEPDLNRLLIVQGLLAHICDYVRQTEYIGEGFQQSLEEMRENLFNLS